MNKLKFFRTRECLKASDIADFLHTSRQAVCGYENEHLHRQIPVNQVEMLCDYLHCRKVELLQDEILRVPLKDDYEKADLIEWLFNQIESHDLRERVRQYVKEH